MAKAKTSLLASIKAEPPRRKHQANWFDAVDAAKQNELLELRTAYARGELAAYSKSDLYGRCKELLGLTISRSAFITWMDKSDDQA